MIRILKKFIILLLVVIVIAILYKVFSKEEKTYIDEVLTQEEIGMTERLVLDYIRNTKKANNVYIEECTYLENDNVCKITIKVNDYKLYDAYVDLSKKNDEGKYDYFVVVER